MSSQPIETAPEIEQQLEAQIEPWLAHMRWRADFAEWRERRIWQENYQAHTVALVERIAQIRPGREKGTHNDVRVLDLGAGMGGFSVAMQRAGKRIVAFDYNYAYCEIARTRARRYDLNLPALAGAGEALPFANGNFEIVTCWDVLEHVQKPEHLLSEISRVLVPDGIAFITVINRYALVDPHYHLRFVNYLPRPLGEKYIVWRSRTKASNLRDKQRLSDMHYYTFGAFQRFAAQFGFCVEDLQYANSRFRRYPQPLGDALYTSWRTFGMGTYQLVLQKSSARSAKTARSAK